MSRLLAKLRERWRAFATHPLTRDRPHLAMVRYVLFHTRGAVSRAPWRHSFVDDTVFEVRPGMAGIAANVFFGLQDFEEMAFLMHLLDADDAFVDVGANRGSYSLLAAGVSGAETWAFEPNPEAYLGLMRNVRLNRLEGQAKYRLTSS